MKYIKPILALLIIGSLIISCSTKDKYPTGPAPEPDITDLLINEFMASNDAAYADENGEFDDWIEIYNPSDFDLDLGGVYITDSISDSTMTTWQIPVGFAETIIQAHGFLILWADKEPEQGPLHVNIKLSGGGEDIALTSSDGVSVIDQLTYEEQETDVSYGRFPDGSNNWQSMIEPTPGTSNTSSDPVIGLVINEFMSHNDTAYPGEDDDYPDWIELYNTGNVAVDVGGWYLTDDLANLTLSMIPTTEPETTTIQPNGYLILIADSQAFPGVLHLDFKLSDDEDFALVDPDGVTIVDQHNTGVVPDDMSEGRVPDGSDNWEILDPATPGGPN